jgi:hypothetical protein
MVKHKEKILVGLVIATMLFVIETYAAGLSMGPVNIEVSAVREGEYERILNIYNPGSDALNVLLNVDGNASDWIYFYSQENLNQPIENITIPANTNSQLTVKIKIPEDTPTDYYNSIIFARAFLAEADVGTGIRLRSNVNIHVTGDQVLDGVVENITIKNTEINHPLTITVYFKNKGNVIARPLIDVTILKDSNSVIQSNYQGQDVGVGLYKMLEAKLNTTNQEVGDYVANVKVYLEENLIDEENLNFKILERGILTAQGSVLSVKSPQQIDSGDVAKIDVEFVNIGQIDVLAKLSGEIYLNNIFVDVLESDENLVGVGKIGELTAYFKPTEDGMYTIKSNVVYEGKKESIQDITIAVGESSISGLFALDTNSLIIFVVLAVILIAFGVFYKKFKK